MPGNRRLTIIVVPETGKRTLTFRLARTWFAVLGILLCGLTAALVYQYQEAKSLEANLVELDQLKRINRQQQAQISVMRQKTEETEQRLSELAGLEDQIRQLTDPNAPSRSGLGNTPPTNSTGRGGPGAADNLPTLGVMLPPEVRAHLFASRDTLPLHLAQPAAHKDTKADEETITEIQDRLDLHIEEMDRLAVSLTDGKKAIEEQLDYMAHRPTGFPVSGAVLTDRFGMRWSPFGLGRQKHEGLDLAHDYWTPVTSTGQGVVIHAGWKSGGYGYTVMIDHGYGFVTMYAHMADTKVSVGDSVKRGQQIGGVGSSGLSTGPHLHYEVHLWGVPTDPAKYIN